MTSPALYFDYAATTPCAPEVAESIYSSLKSDCLFANASSAHSMAYVVDDAIQEARDLAARLLGAEASNIIFTSGATESNNLALIGISKHLMRSGKAHIVSSSTEHKAVLDTLKHLEGLGHSITLLDPDKRGLISADDIRQAITPITGLISIMHVNNETGVIQDLPPIGQLAKEVGAVFHVDAAQSAGKIPIDIKTMNIDLLSVSAHKFYGPKGVGALYVRKPLRSELSPSFHGGGQEKGVRPGTYANHQIIGFGAAIAVALEKMKPDLVHARNIREIFVEELKDVILQINGSEEFSLPNILNVSIDGIDATTLLTSLQNKIALATGSACNSGAMSASHVLTAMGLDGDELNNSIRISFGRYTTSEQVRSACEIIKTDIERIKNLF